MFGLRIKQKKAGIATAEPHTGPTDFTPVATGDWEEDSANLSTLNREIHDIQHQLRSHGELESRLKKLQGEKRAQLARHIKQLQSELAALDSGDEVAASVIADQITAAEKKVALEARVEKEAEAVEAPAIVEAEIISMVPDDVVVAASGAAMEEAVAGPQLSPVERAQSLDELVAAADLMDEIPKGFSMTDTVGRRVLGKAGWKWTIKEVAAGRMDMDMLPDDFGFKSKLREIKSFTDEANKQAEAKKEEPKPEATAPWQNPAETLTAPQPLAVDVSAKPMTEEEKTRAALLAKLSEVRNRKNPTSVALPVPVKVTIMDKSSTPPATPTPA
jgi:hypothetical protein